MMPSAMDWLRVFFVSGLLTAMGARFYGRPFALAGLFIFYVVMCVAYLYHEVAGYWLAAKMYG